jgi:hypothetical protein
MHIPLFIACCTGNAAVWTPFPSAYITLKTLLHPPSLNPPNETLNKLLSKTMFLPGTSKATFRNLQLNVTHSCFGCQINMALELHSKALLMREHLQLTPLYMSQTKYYKSYMYLQQEHTNPRHPATMATKFCTTAPNICESQHTMCFMSCFWHLKFGGGSWIFGKFVHPNLKQH